MSGRVGRVGRVGQPGRAGCRSWLGEDGVALSVGARARVQVQHLPSQVVCLKLYSSKFSYKPGQYVFLNCPSLSTFEVSRFWLAFLASQLLLRSPVLRFVSRCLTERVAVASIHDFERS